MNLKQHRFVTEYLRWGDGAIAYQNAYNSTSNAKTIESAANRLLKNPEVAQAIADAQAGIRARVEAELAEQLKGELLTIQHKRELLYQIATGAMQVEQTYKGKDCNACIQYIRPTINQMLRAIHLDSKLAGHYPLLNTKYVTAAGPASAGRNGAASLKHDTTHEAPHSSPPPATPPNSEEPTPESDSQQQNNPHEEPRNTSPLKGDRGKSPSPQMQTLHTLDKTDTHATRHESINKPPSKNKTHKKHNKSQHFSECISEEPLNKDRKILLIPEGST